MQLLRGDGVTSPPGKTPDRPVRLHPGRKKPNKLEAVRFRKRSRAACGDHRGIVENIYAYVILRIGALHKFYDSSAKRDAGC